MEGYAMNQGTTHAAEVIRLRQDIGDLLRRRVLEAVQLVLEEELSEALGSGRYERCDERRGYRNGHETRKITTELGQRLARSLGSAVRARRCSSSCLSSYAFSGCVPRPVEK